MRLYSLPPDFCMKNSRMARKDCVMVMVPPRVRMKRMALMIGLYMMEEGIVRERCVLWLVGWLVLE